LAVEVGIVTIKRLPFWPSLYLAYGRRGGPIEPVEPPAINGHNECRRNPAPVNPNVSPQ